jgi:RNAse (barnase) inhibitor barstar
VIRGHKAATETSFFDECSAAWQFPYYFGENWDAFEECLTDLEWLPADAYVFLVNRSVHLLEKESDERFLGMLRVLQRTAREWGQPSNGRSVKPFHVLLQCTAAEQPSLEQRLQAAGMSHDIMQ